MNAPATTSMQRALPAEHWQRLMQIAHEVSFPQGARLFEEGRHADRFWIIRTGTVDLDMEVRREVVSYLFPGPVSAVRVEVRDGIVRLGGRVRDTSLVPVAARLVRAVEGVVDVEFELTGSGSPTEPTAASADGDESRSPA